MATLPVAPKPLGTARFLLFSRARTVLLFGSLALLMVCLTVSWMTRDSMAHLPFLNGGANAGQDASGQNRLVDISPWLTAQALAPLAVTAEEDEYARQAERLADHEVDQAFASALRQASEQVEHRVLTGAALAYAQKVAQLQLVVQQDQALVQGLTKAPSPTANSANPAAPNNAAPPAAGNGDLELAQAQLALDSDELDDAQANLARAGGDDRARIQAELAEHEATMHAYDSASHGDGEVAVVSVARHPTLAARLKSWDSQRDRYQSIQQAIQQTQADLSALTVQRNALEAQVSAGAAAAQGNTADRSARLAELKEKSADRQILTIYNDRVQTEQQLAVVYRNWSAQVLLQHRILLHLSLQSLALIAFIFFCVVLCDGLVQRVMARPSMDQRQMHTLRNILKLAIQIVGALLMLLVIFGPPSQISTIFGLATAGITIAMQDFIIAFFGWFVLMGKHGIRVGDWVEINGVGGEVAEIGLFRTTLLETGDGTDSGHQTGRRVALINSYAIRGQYFNFSTAGQWMWDEITVNLPSSDNAYAMAERIHKAVLEETDEVARVAEKEWKRGTLRDGKNQFSATPTVNLRPSGTGIDLLVRYVTRAAQRFEMRNRLYQRVIDLLHEPAKTPPPKNAPAVPAD